MLVVALTDPRSATVDTSSHLQGPELPRLWNDSGDARPPPGGPMEPPRPHGNSGKLGAASSLGRAMALTVSSKCSALCPAGFSSAPWITQCCSEEAESQAPSNRLGCLPCKPGEPGTSLFIYSQPQFTYVVPAVPLGSGRTRTQNSHHTFLDASPCDYWGAPSIWHVQNQSVSPACCSVFPNSAAMPGTLASSWTRPSHLLPSAGYRAATLSNLQRLPLLPKNLGSFHFGHWNSRSVLLSPSLSCPNVFSKYQSHLRKTWNSLTNFRSSFKPRALVASSFHGFSRLTTCARPSVPSKLLWSTLLRVSAHFYQSTSGSCWIIATFSQFCETHRGIDHVEFNCICGAFNTVTDSARDLSVYWIEINWWTEPESPHVQSQQNAASVF